jgi:hypothetical protein
MADCSIAQCPIERCRAPGSQRDQRAPLVSCPLLELADKSPADAMASVLVSEETSSTQPTGPLA